jgi:TnpA family transposase
MTHPLGARTPQNVRRYEQAPLEELSADELDRIFAPNPRFQPVLRYAYGPAAKVALYYHAALLEALGRAAPFAPIPEHVVHRIARALGETPPLSLPYPEARATFFDHAEKARRLLGWRKCGASEQRGLLAWLSEIARQSDDPDYLRAALVNHLLQGRMMLPGASRIDRLVGQAKTAGRDWVVRTILSSKLSRHHLAAIDSLRDLRAGLRKTRLQWLRDPIGSASPKTLDDLLDRLDFVTDLALPPEPFEEIHPDMRRRMVAVVEGYPVDGLWVDFSAERRRALVACYLYERQQALVDFAVEAFDGIVLGMFRRSEADLDRDERGKDPTKNRIVHMFKTMTRIVVNEAQVVDLVVRPAIYSALPREILLRALEEAESVSRPEDYNCFDYLKRRYTYLRSFFPRFLRTVELEGVAAARPVLEAVAALKYWNAEGIRKVTSGAPCGFVPEKWKAYVFPEPGAVDRHYWELCLMDVLHRALLSGDVWAVGGRRYGNVEDLLISRERWALVRDQCYQELGLPKDPAEFLGPVLADLGQQIKKTTANLPANPQVFVIGDRVHLKAIDAAPVPDRLRAVKEEIDRSWPEIRIQDLLVEVDSWIHFMDVFSTLTGAKKSGRTGFRKDLLASLIAKGCNIGVPKMASLSPGVTQGSLRRVDENYLHEEALKRAYQTLLRAHHNLPMASWMGSEERSMSDGMRISTRVGTLNAALQPQLLGPGERALTYYWHVSHQGPAYAGQVIGSERDAAYTLDQILHIKSELPIKEHCFDTHGITENTFGMSPPFGVDFCPRIKNVHEQDLYHPPGTEIDGPLKFHFAAPVDVELIEKFWDDYVRILATIKTQKTSAVILSLRLSSYARHNPLYRALREVGRIYKTRFIMRYYDEPEFRRTINASLNRIELFNYLARYLFYARRGENWEREFEQQRNRASALLILANACVLWNTVHLTEVAKRLKEAGVDLKPEDFEHVSPYAFDHIIAYGQYYFDFRRKDRQGAYTEAHYL